MSVAPLRIVQDPVASAWRQHAGACAAWVTKHLVNRWDVFGHYRPLEERRDRDLTAYADKSGLTLAKLTQHFRGQDHGDILGLYSTALDEAGACVSRWGAIDIDRHDEKTDPATTLKAALSWLDRLVALGFRPLLLDSNGNGGYHLLILFSAPVPTSTVFRFLRWLTRDWKDQGLAERPETFPKQPSIAADRYGNWLRVFGRHHTHHDHWTKVWGDDRWLEGVPAIKAIIGTAGDPANLIPAEALEDPAPRKPRPAKLPKVLRGDAELVREVIEGGFLDHMVDEYDGWVEIGQCLAGLGLRGLTLWDAWSRRSSKYNEGDTERKWQTFRPDGGRTLGTLFHHAQARGWEPPKRAAKPARPRPAPATGNRRDEPPEPVATGDELPYVFTNYAMETVKVADEIGGEKDKQVKVALRVRQLADGLQVVSPGWPKRVGIDCTLFLKSSDHRPVYLDSSTRLFSYLDTRAIVDWSKGNRLITQERFYEHLRMNAEHFDAIETQPHWPRLPGIYYMHPEIVAEANGSVDRFLDFFLPSTDEDRELMRAFLLTLFWGGAPGSRPAFLLTGEDGDPHQGRGIGKTHFIESVAALVGGYIDVSPTDPIADVKTRLLSDAARQTRLARLDNVKTLKFSWADLEGLITATEISGRMLYRGEGRRPNTLVWALTLNGASLSKDMAQRSVIIKLSRPVFSATWERDVREFVGNNRLAILADVRAFLEGARVDLKPATRWAAWEEEILARGSRVRACQKLILERQGSVDDDECEKDLVAENFRRRIFEQKGNPDHLHLFIRSSTAAMWLEQATGERRPTNRASAYLKGLGIPELRPSADSGKRGWRWRGAQCNPNAPAEDLEPEPAQA